MYRLSPQEDRESERDAIFCLSLVVVAHLSNYVEHGEKTGGRFNERTNPLLCSCYPYFGLCTKANRNSVLNTQFYG